MLIEERGTVYLFINIFILINSKYCILEAMKLTVPHIVCNDLGTLSQIYD